jgi:hypothetical protein
MHEDGGGGGGASASSAAAVPPPPSAAGVGDDESELVRLGDIVLGVSGVCTLGMAPALLETAIDAARRVTPGGCVVLHVCEVAIDASLIDEVTLQMASAAAELLGSRDVVERVQSAVYAAIVMPGGAGAGAGAAAAARGQAAAAPDAY